MIDPVDIIGFEGCLKVQKMIKSNAIFEDIKKEFRHIEESVLKSYFDRIIRTQNTICMMRYQTGIRR